MNVFSHVGLAAKVTHFCFVLLSVIALGSIIGGSIGGFIGALILIISIILIIVLCYYCCKSHRLAE